MKTRTSEARARANQSRMPIATAVCAALAGVTAVGPSAMAQQAAVATLEEVVVTAERRAENLQRTAVAVSIREGEALQQQGRFTVNQILEDVPSIVLQPPAREGTNASDTPSNTIGIRGVVANGQVNSNAAPVVPAVAQYVDGVVHGLGSSYDLTRVEVLRGPQGTLYGRSATAGVVNMFTANPVLDRYGGNAAVEAGNYNLRHYTGALNVPAGDTLALRISGNYYNRDGYYASEGAKVDDKDMRAKLLYKPSDDFSLLLGVAYQKQNLHTGETSSFISGTGTEDVLYVSGIPLGSGWTESRQYWAQVDWNLGAATLTYIPALRSFKQSLDAPSSPAPGVIATATIEVPHDEFHTQELRLTSNSTSPLSWQTGVYYYRNSLNLTYQAVVVGGPFPAPGRIIASQIPEDRLTENVGAFGESTYHFTDSTRLTAGVRGDYTKVQTSAQSCTGAVNGALNCLSLSKEEGTRSWRNFTYKLRLEKDLTADNLLYASVSSAFLPGDVAVITGANGAPTRATYDAETLTAMEIGSKNRFLDERLQVNGGVFYYRYGGYQVPVQIGQIGGQGGTAVYQTMGNPARMFGAELELLFQPTSADKFGLSVSYTDASLVDKSAVFAAGVANSEMRNVVPWIINATYSHTFTLPNDQSLTFLAEGRYRSGYLVQNLTQTYYAAGLEPYLRNGDTLLGNATLTWNFASQYSLSGYVRNVSDVRYKTTATLNSAVPTGNASALSDPRTYGVVASVRF